MKINVECVICGNKGKIFILFRKIIISRKWKYFSFTEWGIEYFECNKCSNSDK